MMTNDRLPTFSRLAGGLAARLSGSGPARRLALRKFDRGLFYRQLASMLRGGVPLPQAVGFLTDEFRAEVAARLEELRRTLESGTPLSAALAPFPEAWLPREDRAAIAAGERAGRLPDVLDGLAADRERQVVLRNRVRSVMAYPLTVLALVVFVATILIAKHLPTVEALYASLKAEVPATTRVFLGLSGLVARWSWLAIPAFVVWRVWLRGRIAPRLPVVRTIDASLVELRFARLLALLLEAGVPFDEALALCEPGAGRPELSRQVRDAVDRTRRGERPSDALRGLTFLSPVFLWFLSGAEERGDFVAVTAAAAETAEERYVATLDLAQRIAEPVTVVLLGLLVGLLVVACYAPMFQLVPLVGY
jgi:type II secretory pathway component PulF